MDNNFVSSSTFSGTARNAWTRDAIAPSSFFQVLTKRTLPKTKIEDRPAYLYDRIEEALKFLSSREPGDEHFVKPEAAHHAIAFLYILRHAQIPAPRIVPGDDGDDVTFTWDSPEVKRLLTISVNSLSVTQVHRPTRQRVFTKHSAAIERPNEVIAQIGQVPKYPAGVASS